ncbi:uncharacterized protein LOC117644581 [Thrips palmi]|uniref:Uncharacterized protein LOC117644581 n=1 Tax=Thrips palmi TaxID=161013 RepID=A0A6P8ZM61_THRPL|nr:uncharacterized protein LOC117644581 [Thrips palmi]
MFALCKYKRDSKIDALPVSEIHVVVKKDGEKTFEPFAPTGVSDFRPFKQKKYVVFSEEGGLERRWYITIGRLGASRKKLLKKASKVEWLPSRDARESFPSDSTEASAPTGTPVDPAIEPSVMDVDDNPGEISATMEAVEPTKAPINSADERTSKDMDEPMTDAVKAVSDEPKPPQTFVKLAVFEEAMSLQGRAIRALEEQLQDTNNRLDACKRTLPDLDTIFIQAIEGTVKNEFSRLQNSFDILQGAFQKLLSCLQDIKEKGNMAQVLDWVNKIPTDLNLSMAITDVSKTNVKEKLDGSSSDDTLENVSESSTWLRFISSQNGTQVAEGSITTASDETTQHKSDSNQQMQTEIEDDAVTVRNKLDSSQQMQTEVKDSAVTVQYKLDPSQQMQTEIKDNAAVIPAVSFYSRRA